MVVVVVVVVVLKGGLAVGLTVWASNCEQSLKLIFELDCISLSKSRLMPGPPLKA